MEKYKVAHLTFIKLNISSTCMPLREGTSEPQFCQTAQIVNFTILYHAKQKSD